MPDHFDSVWLSITSLDGQTFHTKKGLPFTYSVDGNTITPSRANQAISRSDFEKAHALMPLEGPGEISSIVRGSAYVWAILNDGRVRA